MKRTRKKQEIKKNQKEEEEEKQEKKIIKSESKQLMWFLIIIVLLFLSFLLPYYYIKTQQVFEFAGVTWQVEKHGDITLYYTQFSKIFMGTYYGEHNTFLRNDPRKNNIPIDVKEIFVYPKIIISQSPDVLVCDKQVLVTDALYQITLAMPFIRERIIAITDSEVADEIKRDYAVCEDKPDKTTIFQVELGNESRIRVDQENNCYFITIKDCKDNLKTAERFIIEIIKELNKNN